MIDFVESFRQVYSAQIGRIASLYVLIDDVSSSKYSVLTPHSTQYRSFRRRVVRNEMCWLRYCGDDVC